MGYIFILLALHIMDPYATINDNDIWGNVGYQLRLGSYYNAGNVWLDATDNWWGTTDATDINDLIYDYHDYTSSAYVDFPALFRCVRW